MSQGKDDPAPFHNPFGALEKLRDELPAGPAEAKAARDAKGPARAVVRYERKGRGGKEVTIIDQLELGDEALTAWCKAAKQALGCGGSLEERAIVLQGDQRERVRAWLTERGVRKISG